MRNFTKKLRIKSRKKFSLESNNHEIISLDKQLEPISVVLQSVKFHDSRRGEASWFQEDTKLPSDSRETTPTSEDVVFSALSDGGLESRTTGEVNLGAAKSTADDQFTEEKHQAERWTKDVIFEAEQLVLKSEIEKLRNRTDKERKRNKLEEDKHSFNEIQKTNKPKLEKRRATISAAKHSDAVLNTLDKFPVKQRRSTWSKISRKFGKLSLNRSMESPPNKPSSHKIHEIKSEKLNHEGSKNLRKWSMTKEQENSTNTKGNSKHKSTAVSKVSRKLERFKSKSMESSLNNDSTEGQFKIRESHSEMDLPIHTSIHAQAIDMAAKPEIDGTEDSTNGLQNKSEDEMKLEKWSSLPILSEHGTTVSMQQPSYSKVSQKLDRLNSKLMEQSIYDNSEGQFKIRESKSDMDIPRHGSIHTEAIHIDAAKLIEDDLTNESFRNESKDKMQLEKWSSLLILAEHGNTTGKRYQSVYSRNELDNHKSIASKSMESLLHAENSSIQFQSQSKRDFHQIYAITKSDVDAEKTGKMESVQNDPDEVHLEKWSSLPAIAEHDNATNITGLSDISNNIRADRQRKRSVPFSKMSRKCRDRFASRSMESICIHGDSENRSKIRKCISDRNITLVQEGSMALLRAAKNNSVIQASSLLRHGISPEILDRRGWTPLCIALEYENYACAEVLVRWRANVNFIHEDGTPILHHMTLLGSYKAISFLLRHGVDVNIEDSKGWPAVHYALQEKHLKCTALLIAGGVNVEVYTSKRVSEFKTVVKMSTVGKWTYKWQNFLDIDFENETHL